MMNVFSRAAMRRALRTATLALLFTAATGLQAQVPDWIWTHSGESPAGEAAFARKVFDVAFTPSRAEVIASGDDSIVVYLNGAEVARSDDWHKPAKIEVTDRIRRGKNVLAIHGKNGAASAAAMVAKLELRTENGFGIYILSDKSWVCSSTEAAGWMSADFAAADWKPAVSFGKVGVQPWGNILAANEATPAESLTVLPGFKAELLKSADEREGSWICMTVDHKGRLIISPEKELAPMLRITLTPAGKVAATEPIPAPVRGAMGLLYAHDSLYVNGRGPKGVGLYRLIDANHNDQFDADEVLLLKNFEGDNEHGYHAVVLGPDDMIYVLNGNHTKVPAGLAPNSPYRNFDEDLLLPRMWDSNGHAKGVLAPGGYVLKTDPHGQRWELICGGFRNAYDLDFNTDGEMFTFDADMEWDVGSPWYRPNRVDHCVSGGEYGWRSGTGKWPVYYPDSLPTNLDIGLASPTGVKFGTKSNFPEKYRNAFFIADWNYGKIFAVHLKPDGASYSGDFETFVAGRPLAVSDIEFGHDGAMYFIIGGWKMQSGLYRISQAGTSATAANPSKPQVVSNRAAEARALRRKLEAFHGKKDPRAIEVAWPHLDSPDRWLRFAARVAIEWQDVAGWAERALTEPRPQAALTALLAMARTADRAYQVDLLESLSRVASYTLTEAQTLEALRVLQLSFIRMGRPELGVIDEVASALAARFPAKSESVNRELSQLLVYLEAPDAISETLALMGSAPSQEQQMHYAFVLRAAKRGWTMEQRRVYFSWFNKALREFQGGNSFAPYLRNIRDEAAATLTETEHTVLAAILNPPKPAPAPVNVPPRAFVNDWTFDDLAPHLDAVGKGRSFAKGKAAFQTQCQSCHRIGNEGGAVGPELNGVSGRFSRRDLLDHVFHPSKVISDRYQTVTITKRDGDELSGCVIEETDQKLVIVCNPLSPDTVEVKKSDVEMRGTSKVSMMPEGLLTVLTRDEILDLIAFVEAGGRSDSTMFSASK